jgi:peptidoglycan/LPS O-acetylase OafA/YrhL
VKFYERRARRILPALFVVMLATTIVGYFLMMPDEYKNLGQSLVATSLFSNNILLGITSGYWDLASNFKPLLHTWSLGVEEQYYIFTPIVLMLAWKMSKKSIPLLLWIVFATSLLFSIWFVYISPAWAFYILPTRAWELAVGGIATFIMRSTLSISNNNRISNALSLLGFAAILLSIFTFNESTPIPSYPLLLPVLGAALIIIFCQPETFVYSVLSHKWIVFTGLLSYSLYLWHQPFFAFLRVYAVERQSEVHFLMLIPVIYFISYLTWRYIETPFRKRDLLDSKTIFAFSIVGGMTFVIAGLYLNHNYGSPNRLDDPTFIKQDMDKRIYNQKAFTYKADKFSNEKKLNS